MVGLGTSGECSLIVAFLALETWWNVQLAAHWRCLLSRLNIGTDNATAVVTACVILQNTCEEKGHEVYWQEPDRDLLVIPFSDEPVQALDSHQKTTGTAVREEH